MASSILPAAAELAKPGHLVDYALPPFRRRNFPVVSSEDLRQREWCEHEWRGAGNGGAPRVQAPTRVLLLLSLRDTDCDANESPHHGRLAS